MGIVGLTYSLAQGLGRYGVTVNAIAPGAHTRLTASVPTDKAPDPKAFPEKELTPENITPVAVFMASERSRWLTGRTLSAAGYEVALMNNPEAVRQINGSGPWEYERLAELMERTFRPVADGLPQNPFAAQV
jgi:hypothetical protein